VIPVITAIVAASIAALLAGYRERLNELTKLLVAARVVGLALTNAASVIEFAEEQEMSVAETRTFLQAFVAFSEVWQGHRDVLARHLSRPQWDALAHAADAVTLLVAAEVPRALGQEDDEAIGLDNETFGRMVGAIRVGAAILGAYSDRPGRLWRNPGRAKANRDQIREDLKLPQVGLDDESPKPS
jgi:hypothetical protein